MQRHPQSNPFLARMRIIVYAERRNHCGRQWFHEQGLRHIGRNQDEDAVAPILVAVIRPRDSRVIKRIPHYLVQAVTNHHLVPIGAGSIPEPLDVDNDDRPVDGHPSSLHTLSPTAMTQTRCSGYL
jgi:hypothetical protein